MFQIWNNTINLFYLVSLYLQLVSGLSTSVTRLQFVFYSFLDFLRNHHEQSGSFFETFSGGFILLQLEIISFIPIIFKLLFRGAGFAHYLRMFSRFFPIVKSGHKGQYHFTRPRYYQEILFDQCRFYPSLFQLSLSSILHSQ